MMSIKKALILSLGIHLVGIFGGGFFLKRARLKDKKVIYPVRLIEIAESSLKPVIRPKNKKKPKPKIVKKKVPQKPPEPKKGIPIKKQAEKEKAPVEKEKKQVKKETDKTELKKEEEKKLIQAIEEIKKKKALAIKEKEKYSQVPKRFIERQLQLYAAEIDRLIKRNWSIPKAFSQDMGDLEAIVVIRIDPNGELKDTRLEKPSGVHPFDESTLRAIKKAAPFPAPPLDLKKEELEFEIRFYSNQMG